MDDANIYHDRSGMIATGGAAQTLLPAKPSREGWGLFNNSTSTLLINLAGAASATVGIEVPPKSLLEMPDIPAPRGEVSIFGAVTGAAFTCWEW